MEATVAVPESPESALDPLKMVNPDEERRDWSAHTAQFQRLVTTALAAVLLLGAWGIWRDVVPALGFLDRYCLWTKTVTVVDDAGSVVADGQPTLTPHERIEPVTLADLGLTVLIAIVTLAAARNIPGLMEMSVLQRLPLDNSVRYAVSALASYAIVLVGVIVGCKTIGLQWSQIQWLATALTFGLAFGLQEMFANFVAGLIILFERPMRVGDVVTVDQTTGVVSRIRIRATTITNWDRKEFIVPNKEFITGKILNWTLSDQINRVVVNVGVAYGSNTELVHRLLLKAAEDHPLVLDDPPPLASFEGFGESTLDFVLRAFLPSLENRLKVIHELHTAVDKLFREADIEIAFPQRDLHVRSIGQPFSSLVESAVGPTGQPNSDAA